MTLKDIRNLFVEIVCFEMKSANSEELLHVNSMLILREDGYQVL